MSSSSSEGSDDRSHGGGDSDSGRERRPPSPTSGGVDARHECMERAFERDGRPYPSRELDVKCVATLTMREALEGGCTKNVVIARSRSCPTCWGTGTASAADWERCGRCGGRRGRHGKRDHHHHRHPRRHCGECNGWGYLRRQGGALCGPCEGRGSTDVTESVAVRLVPWSRALRVRGYGHDDVNPLVGAGDARVAVRVETLESACGTWSMEDGVVTFQGRISLADALCGFTHDLRTPDGRTVPLRCAQVVKPERLIVRVEGQGAVGQSGARGVLVVVLPVAWPDELLAASPATRRALASLKTAAAGPSLLSTRPLEWVSQAALDRAAPSSTPAERGGSSHTPAERGGLSRDSHIFRAPTPAPSQASLDASSSASSPSPPQTLRSLALPLAPAPAAALPPADTLPWHPHRGFIPTASCTHDDQDRDDDEEAPPECVVARKAEPQPPQQEPSAPPQGVARDARVGGSVAPAPGGVRQDAEKAQSAEARGPPQP